MPPPPEIGGGGCFIRAGRCVSERIYPIKYCTIFYWIEGEIKSLRSLRKLKTLSTFIGQKPDVPLLYFVAMKNKSKQSGRYGTTE